VFGNRVGERTSYSTFKKGWKRAHTEAGITGLHFHDLRREFASRLLETPGVSLHDVADWVGHSNVTTTSRYLRTTGVRRQHIARKFEEARRAVGITDGQREELQTPSAQPQSH
jgi:integrase